MKKKVVSTTLSSIAQTSRVASPARINEVTNYFRANKMYKTKKHFKIQESTVARYMREYNRINRRTA